MDIKLNGENLENAINSWINYRKWEWKVVTGIIVVSVITIWLFLEWISKLFNM
jgi:hypothetical protein